jgi:phosphoserine aminotransferase
MAKKKNLYQDKVEWDDMSFGEVSHHIGKKMTEKSHKLKSDYKRKPKYKNWDITDNDDE